MADMKPVSQLRSAADLSRKLDSLRSGRHKAERDWKLNVAFYKGNQYSYWNPGLKQIASLPVEDGEKPRYRVRIVANQIVLGVQSIVAKILKTKPMWGATAQQPGDKAQKAAAACEDLLESWWHSLSMGSKYQEVVIWSQLAANGYWKLSWDQYAAKAMRFLLDPNGQPITDAALAAEFRAQLEQRGIEPQETVVYMGDVKVEVMSPMDIFGDDTAKSAEEWKWVFCRHWMTPDQIKTRWKVDVKADAVPCEPDATLPAAGSEAASDPIVKAVWYGYFLPTPELPKGRYVVFIEDPDQILQDGEWPYPIHTLPVVQFKGIRVPGGSSNDAIVTHVRPLQKQLNRLLSQIVEYTNMVIKPRVWAPLNSLRQRMTTEPGAVYEYTPVGNHRPEIEQLPSIPNYVFEFLNDLGSRIREMFGLTEVTEGTLPPNLEAANAIDLLQEMATDRFAPTIMEHEASLARAGQFLLALAQEYYDEPRLMQIRGLGGASSVKEFTKADIAGDITIRVEAGSSLPRSRAARRSQIEKWVEMGLVRPDRAWKHYDIADVKDLALQFQRDEDHALREHDKIIRGIPLNPEAMQQAMAAVNQGLNPETQQQVQSPEEAQQILERAGLTPGPADNHSVHEEKHRDYVTSMEFDNHSPDVRQRFLTHYELTQQKLAELKPPPEPQAPRVSLALKGGVGAHTEAEILKAAGVDIPAEVIQNEPPIATAVYDSVDKPDADAAGAGQEAQHLSQAAQTMMATDVANAKAQQAKTQADELHQHAIRKAKAEADLAVKKARQSDFKPKPAAAKAPTKAKPTKAK